MLAKYKLTPAQDYAIRHAIRRLSQSFGLKGQMVMPSQVAQMASAEGKWEWRSLMPFIKPIALQMAYAGEIMLYHKGIATKPADLKGVYRIGLPPRDEDISSHHEEIQEHA